MEFTREKWYPNDLSLVPFLDTSREIPNPQRQTNAQKSRQPWRPILVIHKPSVK